MSLEERKHLDPCHCCAAPVPAAPASIWNRSGLSAVDYRVGTFAGFRQAMLDAVANQAALREWTTRRSDDYGIALLEMWAYLADILTFYHERGMNEALLRTARHRDSVLRLAALLGYRLHPGVAASTHLAFTLEKEKKLQIPVGLRVQSVPGPGEKPQKFETVAQIAADARLNRVRIYPEPTARDPLARGSDWGVLDPRQADTVCEMLAPGDRVVMFLRDTENERYLWEDKEIVALEQVDWTSVLYWKPAVQALMSDFSLSGASMRKYAKKFRLFGHSAPETKLAALPNSAAPTGVDWVTLNTDFILPSTDQLTLDGIYEDLKPGMVVLLTGSPEEGAAGWQIVHESVVADVKQLTATIMDVEHSMGIMSATVTALTLLEPLPVEVDRRKVAIYQLEGPPVPFWPLHYDPAHEALKTGSGTVYVPVTVFDALEKKRTIIIDDRRRQPQTLQVTSRTPTQFGGVPHLKLAFTPALKRDLDPATAFLYGNVAHATHGEIVAGESLGDGDAAVDFQRFSLKKSPVTFVPDATAPRGAANTLEVRVNGIRWQEAGTLYGQPPDARVFTTRIDDAGVMTVQFGDGGTGARLPTGRGNIRATYRQGLGVAGRVAAGTLTRLVDRPTGLKAVTNPAAAEGGADPELLAQARQNAPNTVRTFDRIVSLRDFEDAAREFTGIAKARAAWEWAGESRRVRLTVACDGGAPLGPETRASLLRYLDLRRDPFRRMRVEDYTERPVLLALRVAAHPDYLVEAVRAAVRATLLEFFAFDQRDLGAGLHLSDLYQRLHEVEGVIAADIDTLIFKPLGWTILLLLSAILPWLRPLLLAWWLGTIWPEYVNELRRRGLRFIGTLPDLVQPRLPVYSYELLSIQEPGTDLRIDVRTVSP